MQKAKRSIITPSKKRLDIAFEGCIFFGNGLTNNNSVAEMNRRTNEATTIVNCPNVIILQ
jgi:hypothetical protein